MQLTKVSAAALIASIYVADEVLHRTYPEVYFQVTLTASIAIPIICAYGITKATVKLANAAAAKLTNTIERIDRKARQFFNEEARIIGVQMEGIIATII